MVQKQYLRVCKNNASLGDIFNGEFGFSPLPCYSSDGSGQVVSLQRFYCQRRQRKGLNACQRLDVDLSLQQRKVWVQTKTPCQCDILPSVTSKLSRKRSSNRIRARASWKEKMCWVTSQHQTRFTGHHRILWQRFQSATISACADPKWNVTTTVADKYNKRNNLPLFLI